MRFANEPDQPDTLRAPEQETQLPVLGISLHDTLTINGEDTGVGAHAPRLEWIQADVPTEDTDTWDGTNPKDTESAAAIALTITLIGRAVEVTK